MNTHGHTSPVGDRCDTIGAVPAQLVRIWPRVPDTASDLTEPIAADSGDTKCLQLGNSLHPALLSAQIDDSDPQGDLQPYRLSNVRPGLSMATPPTGDRLVLTRIVGVIRRRQTHPGGREQLPESWSDVYQIGEPPRANHGSVHALPTPPGPGVLSAPRR